VKSLRKLMRRILSSRLVPTVPRSSAAAAAAWAARHYRDERKCAVAARFALLLEAQLDRPLSGFMPRSRFYEDLNMHDLEPVEVVLAIEQEFQLTVPGAQAAAMRTIDDVVAYLAIHAKN